MYSLFTFFWGCAGIINYATVQKVAPKGLAEPDLAKACRLGESLNHVLPALSNNPPELAMVIADTTAGLCEEFPAWEAELRKERALKNQPLGPVRIAEVKDAQFTADRAHKRAALRYYSAFQYLESYMGEIDAIEECPFIELQDEMPFMIGSIAGVLAVLHDKQSGGLAEVPVDILPRLARVMDCVDNETWWYTPQAIQGAVWVTIPGSGPEGVDPWGILEGAAQQGAPMGVRIGWAMHNLIAANSGEQDRVGQGILSHSYSIASNTADPDWQLLDEYSYWITRHQSDLIWTKHSGHRTEVLGSLPPYGSESEPDEFGEDEFGEDEFGEDEFVENENSENAVEEDDRENPSSEDERGDDSTEDKE